MQPQPAGACVLIVDDSPTQARLAAQVLQAAGFEFQLATNGREALQQARRWRPDVILSDVLMPVMDGFALCRELRRDPSLATIPLVLQTSTFVDRKDADFALALGATRFMLKPAQPQSLATVICEVLDEGCSARSAPVGDDDSFVRGYTERVATTLEQKVAELEAANERLLQQNEALQATTTYVNLLNMLAMVVIGANEAGSVEEALQTCLDQVCAHTGWQVGRVYMCAGELTATSLWHFDDPARFATFKQIAETTELVPSLGLPARVLATGQPAWIADLAQDARFPNLAHALPFGLTAAFAFPIWAGGEIAAVIEFLAARPAGRDQPGAVAPDQRLLDLMAHIGTQIGRVIERQRAEEALRASEARLQSEQQHRLLAEAIPQIVWTARPDGWLDYYNQRWFEYTGLTLEQTEGWRWQDVLHPDDRRRCADRWIAAIETGEIYETEYRFKCAADDTFRWHLGRAMPLRDSAGRIVKWFGTFTDIDDQKRAEARVRDAQTILELRVAQRTKELSNANHVLTQQIAERRRAEEALAHERASLARRVEERTAELSAANAELARAGRLKDEFLASMSHELRTPLNAVLGLSEALQEQVYGALNERQLRTLHSIEESGRHLLSLINDILDLAKIGAGKVDLEIDTVALEPLCQASLRLIREAAHKKQLDVSLVFDPALTSLAADERRLKQILVNLLSNAVKFTPAGGAIGLEVAGDAAHESVRLTVFDTGIGIAPDDLERLFQPFVQLDSRLAREYSGTGLGLALVHRMVELHGGSVAVVSEPGRGSRFTVSLPWQAPALPAEPPASAPVSDAAPTTAVGAGGTFRAPRGSSEVAGAVARPPLILLAEDNPHNIFAVSEYLLVKGYAVEVACDGVEAVARAAELRPDLILMDMQMPGMDGIAATHTIRADPDLAATPIIALTALAMPGDRMKCLKAGADAYLSKPVSLHELVELIEALRRCVPRLTENACLG